MNNILWHNIKQKINLSGHTEDEIYCFTLIISCKGQNLWIVIKLKTISQVILIEDILTKNDYIITGLVVSFNDETSTQII